MNRLIKLLAILFLITLISCSEDTIDFIPIGSISGQIFQNDTGDPLMGVEVSTIPSSSIVYTDSIGQFTFEEIASGEYHLRTRLDNYESQSVTISVVGGSETLASLFLKPETGILIGASNPLPIDGSINNPISVQLNWLNQNDSTLNIKFDINVFESNDDEIFYEATDIEDTLITIQNLKFNTLYYWQITSKNSRGDLEYSKLWQFKTTPFPINQILYVQPENDYSEIYSSDLNGENLTRLTYSGQNKFSPIYNSNRTMIAYLGTDGIEQHIYLMTNEGRNLKKITTIPVASYHQQGRGFDWAPDNSKFIYCHYDKLYSINIDGSNLKELATAPTGRHFRSCHWGQAAQKIVVETIGTNIYEGEIYIMNTDGSALTEYMPDKPGLMENPSFTIDGGWVIFTSDVSENETLNGRQLNSHIMMASITDSANVVDLSDQKINGTNDLFPRISSDGAKIIFVNKKNDGSNKGSIYAVEINNTNNRTELINGADMPSWR